MKKFFVLFITCVLYAQSPVDYETQIAPIFSTIYGCTGCHGGENGLYLTPYENIFITGEHAPVIVPGDTNSILIQKVKGIAKFGARMPFGGEPIAENHLRLLVQWVLEGAKKTPTSSVGGDVRPITTYALKQNYPNPFNPTTTISYQLPANGFVTLKIFDVLGKEITTLVNEEKRAGSYDVKFVGEGMPSGIYFYHLKVYAKQNNRTHLFSEVKKLILLK